MLRNYERRSVLFFYVKIMFFNSGSQLSFSLSYVEDVTVMTRHFVDHSIIRHRIQNIFITFYKFIKRVRNRKCYIKSKFVGQWYKTFRVSTNIRNRDSFFDMSSKLLLLSVSLKIVRKSFLSIPIFSLIDYFTPILNLITTKNFYYHG